MRYELALSTFPEPQKGTKAVFENVLFNDLPSNYAVYLFCYPGTDMNESLRKKLTDLGNIGGEVLFVNFATKLDRNYITMRNLFDISTWPTIIMTGIEKLASPPMDSCTAYVKIDDKHLLDSPELAVECVEKVFNIFLDGKISEAIKVQNRAARNARLNDVLNKAWTGVKQWEISFSFVEGRLSVKPAAGG